MKERAVDFFDVKGDLEALLPHQARFVAASHPAMHPGRSARVELDGAAVGFVGEMHPNGARPTSCRRHRCCSNWNSTRCWPATCPRSCLCSAVSRPGATCRWWPASQVTHDALMEAIHAADSTLVRSARLWDVYKPAQAGADLAAGERSLAVRLELLDDDETLTDDRIEAAVAGVLQALQQRLGVRLRG